MVVWVDGRAAVVTRLGVEGVVVEKGGGVGCAAGEAERGSG